MSDQGGAAFVPYEAGLRRQCRCSPSAPARAALNAEILTTLCSVMYSMCVPVLCCVTINVCLTITYNSVLVRLPMTRTWLRTAGSPRGQRDLVCPSLHIVFSSLLQGFDAGYLCASAIAGVLMYYHKDSHSMCALAAPHPSKRQPAFSAVGTRWLRKLFNLPAIRLSKADFLV